MTSGKNPVGNRAIIKITLNIVALIPIVCDSPPNTPATFRFERDRANLFLMTINLSIS